MTANADPRITELVGRLLNAEPVARELLRNTAIAQLFKEAAASIESLQAACAEAVRERDEASILMLGGTYVTQGGERVTMMKIHNIGTPYETLEDEAGVNRYSRRLGDMGRTTGTAHDYSDPLNIRRPIRAIALREARAETPESALAQAQEALEDAERYRARRTASLMDYQRTCAGPDRRPKTADAFVATYDATSDFIVTQCARLLTPEGKS